MEDYVNICVFGDSIVHGRVDPENGGWVTRLKFNIEKQKLFNKVFNLGIPGDMSNSLLTRLKSELVARKKDIVIIQIGANDAAVIEGENRVDIRDFEANLNSIIRVCEEFGSVIIFIGLSHVDEKRSMPLETLDNPIYFSDENFSKYNFVIERVCGENGLEFVSVDDVLDVEADLFDGVHPNASGHEKIFWKILGVVEGIIGGSDEA